MFGKKMGGRKGASGATKITGGSKPPKQGKVGGISTPFSNKIMGGGTKLMGGGR
jgi:hypothetical protein